MGMSKTSSVWIQVGLRQVKRKREIKARSVGWDQIMEG